MPFGPRAAAKTLIGCLGRIDYAHHVFALVLAYDRPRLMPVISEDSVRNAILRRILYCLKAGTAFLRDVAAQSTSSGDKGRCDLGPKGTIPLLLLTVCFPNDDAPMDTAYLAGYHRALSDELQSLIAMGNLCGMDTGPYLRLASSLWNKLPSHLQGEKPSFVVAGDGTAQLILADPYRHLHNSLRLLHQPFCRTRDCPFRASRSPLPLRKCGKCLVTLYCSQPCQKADWRDGAEPHRELCGMLQDLFQFAPLEMSEHIWKPCNRS
ncbi:hypothetical protein AURDEDRAFT_176181 [Auricularia subglabra TFB-10046 SS5]|uniref:MYND-type domain-containing protein n=1 Tax=Auricularia subglabra (strain TFB-10046 / SS5) TaxID=717982 RepID=J0WQG8_AURST|nr:hypothetical protein AURDEDRAFT_176181 [Auricularia subglabra TFB-10046 SS5]